MKQFTYWYLSATIFLTVSSFGEQQPFPLDKCVAVGFEHNKNLIPFARLDFESAMCDHAGRSPHNVDFTSMLTTVAQNTNDSLVGAAFAVETDPVKGAGLMIAHIDRKRKALGI